MGDFGSCGDVLRSTRQLSILGKDRTSASSRYDLIAVKTQSRKFAKSARMLSMIKTSKRLSRVLDDWDAEVP